jgi:chemotaxis protein CheX
MEQATQAPQGSGSRISSKLVMPFVNSTRQVFTTMVGLETKILTPHLKTEASASYDVSGIIGFSGDLIGTAVVSFQASAAKKLVAAFAGTEMELDSPDFPDAIGELANMIAGCAKKDLGGAANITCPTVLIGSGHHIARLSGVPCVVIPCQTPVGDFAIEVNIKPTK